jgi:hypothetical protein
MQVNYVLRVVRLRSMIREFDTVARRFKDHGMRQGRSGNRLDGKVAVDSLHRGNGIVNGLQCLEGRNLNGQVMQTNILAAIKRCGAILRLPKRNHGVSV